MRVERWFAFVDLSGFTSFGDEFGDDESVRVLTLFRSGVRKVATDFGVRIAKWLGDGCMLVSVEPGQLVAAVCTLEELTRELDLPLEMHAGMAGGAVILLEGDDYTGRCVNLAARLSTVAERGEILCTPELAKYAPEGTPLVPAGMITVAGLHDPVAIVRVGAAAERAQDLS
ncbi:MAG TPA: adenylate/guanylate cyclase domain-containing protein [Acidimicrobiia bacterium]|nr:adenylate/guanylate cyclase domain-containing protein [Acidimicrobiia bacterium]